MGVGELGIAVAELQGDEGESEGEGFEKHDF